MMSVNQELATVNVKLEDWITNFGLVLIHYETVLDPNICYRVDILVSIWKVGLEHCTLLSYLGLL